MLGHITPCSCTKNEKKKTTIMVVYFAEEAVKSIARKFRIILAFQFYCCFIIITESFTLAHSMFNLVMAMHCACAVCVLRYEIAWPRGYKTFFILDSAEHEIYPAH